MIHTYNIDFNNLEALEELGVKLVDHPKKQILIQIFTCTDSEREIQTIIEEVKAIFPLVAIAGTTVNKTLIDGKPSSLRTNVSVTTFDDSRVELLNIPFISSIDYMMEKLDDSFEGKKPSVYMIYSNTCSMDSYVKIETLIEYLDQKWGKAKIAGGGAGNAECDTERWIFSEYGLINEGVIVVSLTGDSLIVTNDYNISYRPMGKKMLVSKAEGYRLYSIDGKTPVEIYKDYLGKDIAVDLPQSAINYPLMHESYDVAAIIGQLKKYKDGSVDVSRRIRVGDQLRIGYFNVNKFIEESKAIYERLSRADIQTLFVFSCASRLETIGDDSFYESESFTEFGTVTGFYSFGEFYNGEDGARLLNQTMTVLGLSEGDSVETDKLYRPFHLKVSNKETTSKHLLKFLATTVREMELENDQLKKMAMKDSLTGLFTRRYFDMQLGYEIKRHTRAGNYLTMIIFDVDYFKLFNDTYGNVVGDDCLRGIGLAVRDTVKREADMACRFEGEKFAVILPETDQKGGKIVAENLKHAIEGLKIPHETSDVSVFVTASFGMLTVKLKDFVDQENIVKLCDEILFQAKETGRNRVVYDQIEF